MKNNILFTLSDYRNLINGYMSSGILKNPMAMFDQKKMRLISSSDRLYSSMDLKNRECRADVQRISAQLTALNPLAVLSRGYGAVFSNNGNVIKSIEQIKKGEIITVKISDGDITAEIINKQGKGDINA